MPRREKELVALMDVVKGPVADGEEEEVMDTQLGLICGVFVLSTLALDTIVRNCQLRTMRLHGALKLP